MSQELGVDRSDPQVAREELERTRARMSETIDEIEDVLIRKKEHLRDRLDLGARIREKPLQAIGIVVGAGFLLGFLTGGGKEADRGPGASARAGIWEARARRLLRIAREQESDIEYLEATLASLEAERDLPYEEDEESGPSRLAGLKEVVVERASDFVGEAARALLEGIRTRR